MKASLNLRQVEIYRAVMLQGTTKRAAETLHISQPGVSKAIQDLERELGFDLFHRVRKRLQPTAEGQLYYREVEESFASLSRLSSAGARIRDFGSGQIRLATLSALSTNIIPRALRSFRNDHPSVSIVLQARMSSTVKDLVATGGFDLGLAADEIDSSGVQAEPFAEFDGTICLPESHPLSSKHEISPEDLDGCPFIALSAEDTSRQRLDRILSDRQVKPRIVLETPFANTVCAMVQAGLGCGLVNPLTAEPFLGRGVILRPLAPRIPFRTLLIQPIARPTARIVADCIRRLKSEVANAGGTPTAEWVASRA